ncbi:MAG: cbb3-type cytochrome oxidase subunit 3 [Polaribacter sp.]
MAVIKKMRNRISTNTRNWKYPPIIIGILMIGMIIKILIEDNNDILAVGILTLFIFLLTGLYFVFDRAKSIEFDNENLFISSKNSDEKIHLKIF